MRSVMSRDYIWIRKWGQLVGSEGYYVNGQIEQAKLDKAPATAIYKQPDGTWVTVEDALRAGLIAGAKREA